MTLVPKITLHKFDKWAIDCVDPINLIGKHTGAHYIITVTNYLTKWAEVTPLKDCTAMTAVNFLFEIL